MVFHQAAQDRGRGGLRYGNMGIFVCFDGKGQSLSQVGEGVGFLLTDFVQNVVEHGHGLVVFRLGMQRA